MAHDLSTLQQLQNEYKKVRENNLANRVVIETTIGNMVIQNEQVMNTILDCLIHEASERIKREMED